MIAEGGMNPYDCVPCPHCQIEGCSMGEDEDQWIEIKCDLTGESPTHCPLKITRNGTQKVIRC